MVIAGRFIGLPLARLWCTSPNVRVWQKLQRDEPDIDYAELVDRVTVRLSPSVIAQWSDPREQLGLRS